MSDFNLMDRMRPKRFADVVGQDAALAAIQSRVKANEGRYIGVNYFLSGPSGVGKTSIAKLIANECAQGWATMEVHASKVNKDWLDHAEDEMRHPPWSWDGHHGYAWIINEVHYLDGRSEGRLLDLMEYRPWVTWIFTTTTAGQAKLFDGDIEESPFMSRCLEVRLSGTGATQTAFAERARAIATELGMNGKPIGSYLILAARCKCNFRMMIQEIAAGRV